MRDFPYRHAGARAGRSSITTSGPIAVFVARQPIVGPDRSLAVYEFLFRAAPSDELARVQDGATATAMEVTGAEAAPKRPKATGAKRGRAAAAAGSSAAGSDASGDDHGVFGRCELLLLLS